jgi:chemotaxis protein methyltransferase CheR
MSLNLVDYQKFCSILQKSCGIALGDNKQYLVSSRMRSVFKDQNVKDLSELNSALQRDVGGRLNKIVVDAMTTNETLWFRDTHPFESLKSKIFPELLIEKRQSSLKLWSAACSTGQEPYSISMAFEEFKKQKSVSANLSIVATDISERVLAEARSGEFSSLSMGRGLSQERLKSWFTGQEGGRWLIKKELGQRIDFRYINLMERVSLIGQVDIAFCRNVLIYFTPEVKREILLKIHGQLKPKGYLFIGASEAINGMNEYFEMISLSPGICYRKK